MLTIILSALCGGAAMAAAVRWVKPIRDVIVRPQDGGGGGPPPIKPD